MPNKSPEIITTASRAAGEGVTNTPAHLPAAATAMLQ
jgi:hypothetical protein